MSLVFRTFCIFIIFAGACDAVVGQDSVRDEIFKETLELFEKADAIDARILSPKNYTDARKHLANAQNLFNKGDKLDKIQNELSKSKEYLENSIKAAELGQVALKEVLAIRSETMDSGLRFNQAKDFTEAEKKLQQAAEKVEKDDLKGARKLSTQAVLSYRKAVLQVLERDYLADAMKKLKDAKKTISNEQFKTSEKTLKDLERLVKSNKGRDFNISELTSSVKSKVEQVLGEAGIVSG